MERLEQIPWDLVVPVTGVLLGLVFATILSLMKFPAARHLGRLIFSWLVLLAASVYDVFVLKWLSIVLVPISLCLYSVTFFSQKTRLSYLHLLPLLLFGIAWWIVPSWVAGVSVLIAATYLLYLIRHLRKETILRGLNWFLNPGDRIGWFRNFLFLNLGSLFYFLIKSDLSPLLLAGLIMLIISMVIYQVFKESTFLSPIPVGNKYKKSTLTPEIKSAILRRIESVMEDFFLRDDASLSGLAKELKVSTHHLSQVLNESLMISFQDLMAKYRIRKACELLKEEANEQLKIENIAAMVGYNSKSAFNHAFKRKVGMTPSEYRSSKDVLTYREAPLSERKVPSSANAFRDLNHVFNLKIKSDMIQHFLKIFGRNVKRNGLFSFLNVLGLTIGFTCSILIYLFIADELSYDKALPASDRIYRIAWNNENPQTRTPHPMAQAMRNDFPEVEQAVSISPWYGPGLSKELVRVKNVASNVLFEEPDFFFADSTFLDVFQLQILQGDKDALRKPWTLMITQSMATKYFGDSIAIGRELELNDMPIAVSAVVEDMPEHSHFHFNAIIPYLTLKNINPEDSWMTWADFGHFNYVKLASDANAYLVSKKIEGWAGTYLDWWEERLPFLQEAGMGFVLQPIEDIHLKSHLRWELENNGNILYIYILTGTLAFLLLIAAINYVNLTTAKSIERAKEVGVRKTLGAVSQNLSLQFYLESIFFCAIAMLISFGLAYLMLGRFNALSGKAFELSHLIQTDFLFKAVALCAAVGLLAGIYPAIVLSAFRPTEVLKGKVTTSSHGVRLRSGLVILQFAISAILISGSLIINRQINFMKDKDLGFDEEAVISLNIPVSVELGDIDLEKVRTVQQQIESVNGVVGTTLISNLPGGQFNQHAYYLKADPESRVDASEVMVDFDFEKVLGIEVIQGRCFDPSFPTDTVNNFIINEIAREQLNLEDPVGAKLVWVGNDEEIEGTIIGVVNDFHYRSMHESIQPLVMSARPYGAGHILVKAEGKSFSRIVEQIEPMHAQLESEVPFEYTFLDEELATLYKQEERTLSIFSVFSLIALVLASLGLLGMAIAILNQRIKEVGMRKILGATSAQIMRMILGQFARLVLIAAVIGLPVSYLLMQTWVTEFSYRAPFGVMPFVWALLVLLSVAMLSVISAVSKITFSNPVDALKYE